MFALGSASAQAPASESAPHVQPDEAMQKSGVEQPAHLGTRVYRWTFYVPVLTFERQPYFVRVLAPVTRVRRWTYDVPEFRTESRKIGRFPEFSCKYPDLGLPNECRTLWHNAYVDVLVAVIRHERAEMEVPEWHWEDKRIDVSIPHWIWVAQTLTIGLPAVVHDDAPPRGWSQAPANSIARIDGGGANASGTADATSEASVQNAEGARTLIDSRRAEALEAIDAGIASIEETIDTVRAQRGDPAQLIAGDGKRLDLNAALSGLQKLREQVASGP